MRPFFRYAILPILLLNSPAWAGSDKNKQFSRIDAIHDWSIFKTEEAGKKICWVATSPVTSKISDKNARRGDILWMVALTDEQTGESSFSAGYPPKEGTTIAQIKDLKLSMFSKGETAWLASKDEDAKAMEMMKTAEKITVNATSLRGTTTEDHFSLKGFAEAWEKAQTLCNN